MGPSEIETEWWLREESAKNIYTYLLDREVKCQSFGLQSPQLRYRNLFMNYLLEVCEKFQFCKATKHLASYIFDLFLDKHEINEQHWQLVALICIIVAVKAEEYDLKIPKISEFNALLNNSYELPFYGVMEMCILQFLDWELLMPTAVTFVDYYALYAIEETDFYLNKPISISLPDADVHLARNIELFVDITLKEVVFRIFRPSLVAAACVAVSRICMHLTPTWPHRLSEVTQYEFIELQSCAEQLIKTLESPERYLRTLCLNDICCYEVESSPEPIYDEQDMEFCV